MPWESFQLSAINYTVFKRKISMQIAKNGLSFIIYINYHIKKSLTYDKLFQIQVHNSYPLNFLFTCKKLLPDDQSPIMLSETFLLSFYSMRHSITLMSIVLGDKVSSVSVEIVNEVNIFFNIICYHVKHRVQCLKDFKSQLKLQ